MSESLASTLSIDGDRVEVALQADADRWSWQRLHPQHPVAIGLYGYYGPVTALQALGLLDLQTRTALTYHEWRCDDIASPGPATRCVCSFPNITNEDPSFELQVFDARDDCLATIRGKGVRFATRDFEAWRAATKADATPIEAPLVRRVAAETLGMGPDWIPFVGDVLERDGTVVIPALVPKSEALQPRHPIHVGSGDHVNVPHLHDCALQAIQLLRDPSRCVGGDGRFVRYIELDVPFELRVTAQDDGWVRFNCFQAGQFCARVGMRIQTR